MSIDSRRAVPDPLTTLQGRQDDSRCGLTALATLMSRLYLCGDAGLAVPDGLRPCRAMAGPA